jgi:hypothetical protein
MAMKLEGFNCNQSEDEVILSVDFTIDAAAIAIAARFDGGQHPRPREDTAGQVPI